MNFDIFSNRMVLKNSPVAFWQWGISFFLTLLLLGGCSSTSPEVHCAGESGLAYSAATDSLSYAKFLDLPAITQENRRAQSRFWLDRFEDANSSNVQIQALLNAAGLAPDNPRIWLQLAHYWRWLGNYLKTVQCLESAAEAIRGFEPGDHKWDKREMQRRTAMARAWVHYDRGEWHEGLNWARAARKVAPGDAEVWQIYGLLAGHSRLRSEAFKTADDILRLDPGDTDVPWIQASYRVGNGDRRQAFNLVMGLNPNKEHQAECWREMGEIAERLAEHSMASRWYEESASSLPFRDKSCVLKMRHDRLNAEIGGHRQLVWLAYDKYYITGSLSSYTSLAFRRFQKSEEGTRKNFWAGQVVNSTGILIRKEMDKPWAYRARGLVFAYGGKINRGIRDLKQASELMDDLGYPDSEIESTLGHLYLQKKNHRDALRHLQYAAEISPNEPRIWQDMGLAWVMSNQPHQAEESFSKALALDASLVTSWYNRGLLNLHQKNYDKALLDLQKAAQLAPDNQDIVDLLQKAHALAKKH